MEDEWLIVYLLRELSTAHPNVWVRVSDADGEFLLVEAANVLPGWLNPEIDQNRVWIHNGKLYIIPLPTDTASSTSKVLTLEDAVDFIRTKPSLLVQSPFIEAEAFYRLGKYPDQIQNSSHHSLVTIPRKLAYILHDAPKTISAAVEAFYLRDAIDLKRILSPSTTLTFPPNDMVTISVRFSKILFAQLRSQRFETPPQWDKASKSQPDSSEKSQTRFDDGMKLTCGYEILSTSASKHKSRSVRELALLLEDLAEDGDSALPSDKEIALWADVKREDDESWMDINYDDFEKELEGKRADTSSSSKPGFGDANTQEDLRKIVSRFEAFLNDDKAGLDGAQLNDMDVDDDNDDDDDDDYDEDSEAEDKDVSFDEEEFSRMMREMMGLPGVGDATNPSQGRVTEIKSETDEIRDLSSQMEAELKEQGALKLDPVDGAHKALPDSKAKDKGKGKQRATEEDEESDDEDVDIDYNLARNLLESFKSQGGMAGPTGNLLGLMGFQLPRDEDDGDAKGTEK